MNNLDDVIAAMYEAVCFDPGGRPDWIRQSELFAENAGLVRVNDSGVFEFDLASYRMDFERMIASGEMKSFWEAELWRSERLLPSPDNG